MKISVIVPVYMAEKHLKKCIESIINQTYKNIEIILVDDGSPDECPKICDDFAKKDDRVIVLHQVNQGVSSARNKALNIANGDYVTFVDADDWIEEEFLEEMISNITSDVDMVVAGFTFDYINEESVIIKSDNKTINGDNIVTEFLLDKFRPEVWGKLIKLSTIGEIRFNEYYGYAEDVLFNYHLTKSCSKIMCKDCVKYHYLQNSGNSSTTPFITVNRKNSYKVFEEIVNDCKNDNKVYSCALYQFTMRVFAILTRVMKDADFSKKYYDEIVNAILNHKKDILKCQTVNKKYKASIILMMFSRRLFKCIFNMIY